MVKAFKIYGPDSTTEIKLDNVEEKGDDNELTLRHFPELSEEFEEIQLPSHERCATHTLHLVASSDMDKARSKSNAYRKVYDSTMAKCQAVWNLCSKSPKACETYAELSGKSPTSPCPTRWNSYYSCILDLLAVKNTLCETLKKLGLPIFKEIEIQFLQEFIKCARPIAEGLEA